MPSITVENGLRCTLCSPNERFFTSRNQLFDHLREEHGFERDVYSAARDRTEAEKAVRSALSNPHHDAYYRRQCESGLMTTEEWEEVCQYFKRPLGVSFRISQVMEGARMLALDRLEDLASENLVVSPFFSSSCRMTIRPLREWSPEAQQALVDAQDLGVANRQELSSMVPPLLLLANRGVDGSYGGKNHPTVLDLCAAPGSKTLQLMDMLNETPSISSGDERYDEYGDHHGFHGLLVANDANRPRLMTVARRARTVGSTLAAKKKGLLLNSSDGRFFPALRKWAGYKLKFDYILADVPCSGDGTLRKVSSTEWQKWNVKQHLSLHKLQVRLLQRSLELVKKGGRVVYSTCSLDPLENEAVVAAAITNMGGPTVYRIMEIPGYLQEGATEPFPYKPGTDQWIVPHPRFDADLQPTVFESFEEVPEELRTKDIQSTMFPPSDEELKQSLKRCCRILPQHLDSGGFFCAIIERLPPRFFAVCYPNLRETTDLSHSSASPHHGRIYHFPDGDASDESDISPIKRLRLLLRADKERRILEGADPETMEFYFEGLPTVQTAQNWLHQHGAFVKERSETLSNFPDFSPSHTVAGKNSWYSETHEKTGTPPYSPLVGAPHPHLVAEFMDFFGMYTDVEEARNARLHRFPVEEMVTVGGGDRAHEVSTNVLGSASGLLTTNKKTKYLQLVLVSREIRSIFSGGAQFNPMEMGLTLCWVPIGPGSETQQTDPTKDKSVFNRAIKSTRYGLLDDATELIGRCASKRILSLPFESALMLLRTGTLNDAPDRLPELAAESSGAIIGKYTSTSGTTDIFLSCAFNETTGSLALLTERRTSSAWLRLLESDILGMSSP